MPAIKVSIFMLTYNQEPFISQAIESIISQKTDFRYQLVIGEDCSTDRTRVICEEFASAQGDKIKLLPSRDKNIGLIKNYMETIRECDGKYIAICDGDDYWIDDCKLQKQVDFLEGNADFSIVYTSIQLLYKSGVEKKWSSIAGKIDTDFDDLIFKNHIPSVSVLFKNIQSEENAIPDWLAKYPFGDWPTYLWTIKNGGKIHYLDEITAVYRVDAGISSEMRKVSSTISTINLNILNDIHKDDAFLHKRKIIDNARYELKKGLVAGYNKEHKYLKGLSNFATILKDRGMRYSDIKMYFYSIFKSIR